mmetsp:Transcript_17402/g.52522  ORF Transcript_17402/g.52522 Transcript_17402/m.52522 type:complete len:201 (+) Transcript_17402:1262-1864(+)
MGDGSRAGDLPLYSAGTGGTGGVHRASLPAPPDSPIPRFSSALRSKAASSEPSATETVTVHAAASRRSSVGSTPASAGGCGAEWELGDGCLDRPRSRYVTRSAAAAVLRCTGEHLPAGTRPDAASCGPPRTVATTSDPEPTAAGLAPAETEGSPHAAGAGAATSGEPWPRPCMSLMRKSRCCSWSRSWAISRSLLASSFS